MLPGEIKEKISFSIASKRIKYLNSKNCKTLMKIIEDNKTDGKTYHVLVFKESISFKWPYYPRKSKNSS